MRILINDAEIEKEKKETIPVVYIVFREGINKGGW